MLLQFYGDLTVENAKELYPQHYMSFVQYKDFAEEIHQNNASKLEESQKRIREIIAVCRELHIYPEIVRKFFIKVLEYIEFLSKEINLQTHEYLVETKEFLRFCRDNRELISYMELSLQAVYSPQDLHEIDVVRYKNEISLAIQFIEENYQQRITLADIAEHVNFSTNYLCKTFKAKTGTNVISYINNLRMKKAGELLKQKDSMVKEVAICVGIDDQLYFSRMFKKHYGISPSEFKSKYL
jgi:two-component system response regulator YesN